MEPCYLNTDVEIFAPEELADLKAFLDSRAMVLYDFFEDNGNWRICIEADESGVVDHPDHHPVKDIRKLLVVLKEAKSQFPKYFESFTCFDFNIGIQAPLERPEAQYTLPKDILKGIIDIGATVTITVYPFEE